MGFSDPLGLERGNLPGTKIPYRIDWNQHPNPNMHVTWPNGKESVITHKGGWQQTHGGKPVALPPKKYREALRPVVKDFVKKAAKKRSFGPFWIVEELVREVAREQCAAGDLGKH